MENGNNKRHVVGEHDDGAVVSIVSFELNGKAAFDVITTPYVGAKPTKAMMDQRAKDVTDCKNAETVSNIAVHLVFDEIDRTCPNAHHAGSE